MEVKEVKDVQTAKQNATQSSESKSNRQREASALTASSVNATRTDAVAVQSDNARKPSEAQQARARANQVISLVNVTAEATSEIEKLVKSIDGIVKQAETGELTEERRSTLEDEANQLVGEVHRRLADVKANGPRLAEGEKVRFEIEEKLGKTLDVLFGVEEPDPLQLPEVKFTRKDAIINTRTAVALAQDRIQRLRDAVKDTRNELEGSLTEIDVATQNKEAAESTIRDVDDALDLAAETQNGIRKNPDSALNSLGGFSKGALNLLEV